MTAPSTSSAAAPRLYLITPLVEEAGAFALALAEAVAQADIAAVLLRLAPADERTLVNRIKALAPIAQNAGAALVIDGHAALVPRAGADGAHLSGADAFVSSVDVLRPKWIAGAGGLHSRHDAMVVAERGADYVMFGEPDACGQRPSFAAVAERVAWWSEVFQTPCVGYAASLDEVDSLAVAGADFVAVGDLVWTGPRGNAGAVAERLARSSA